MELATEPQKRIHKFAASPEEASYWEGDAGDIGYPKITRLGPGRTDVLMAFYDEPPWTNIWAMTLR
jgi:hypothetical protein